MQELQGDCPSVLTLFLSTEREYDEYFPTDDHSIGFSFDVTSYGIFGTRIYTCIFRSTWNRVMTENGYQW
jgi:hypothetical protein